MKSDSPFAPRIAILAALLTFFGTGGPNLWAGSSKWTSIGPFGGSIQSLAIDPTNPETLYAGTESGVFKSTDGGASWDNVNSALKVFSIVIDPRKPSTLYASSFGVFKSIDGGANWSAASSGLPGIPTLPLVEVGALAIDPQNPETLYAGTRTGVFKSRDGGASWNATNSGLSTIPVGPPSPFTTVNRLLIDPQNPNTVYARGTYPLYVNGNLWGNIGGIFKTADGGASWKALILPDSRPPGVLPFSNAMPLAIDSQDPATIYVSGGFPTALLKTSDGGATWSVVDSTMSFFSMAIGPQGSNTLYGANSSGIFKSTDAGLSWTKTGSGLSSGAGFFFNVIDPQDPRTLYASGFDGLFKTTDGGANWTLLNSGLSTARIQALALDPQNSSSMYATYWGLLKSADAGSHWSRVNTGDFYPAEITIDPQDPTTMYADGLQTCEDGPPHYIFKSTDAGSNWSKAMSGLPFVNVNALVIDPTNRNTIYAGGGLGVFKSIDAAASWNAANTGMPAADISALAVDPRTSSTVFAGGLGGVFKSTDGGASWNAVNIPERHSITTLAIDPLSPSTLYAGGSGAIFKSTDTGTTWTASSGGLPSNPNWMNALLIDPQNPSTLYVGTSGVSLEAECGIPCSGFNDGVFKSTDAGATWSAANSGLTTPHVSSLAFDPQNPSRLYAGTLGGGVFAITFGPAPVVTDFRFNQTKIAAGGNYSVTVSGSNLTSQTFFDVRFSAPESNTSDVVLNWQQGLVASHEAPVGTAAGTWTITGVRAHELEADHSESFVPISASITISH